MFDYFNSKKGKAKAKLPAAEKDRKASLPVLTPDDEAFFHHITSQDEGTPPPLPERPQDLRVAGDTTGNASQLVVSDPSQLPLPDSPAFTPGEDKARPEAKRNRWSFLKFDSKIRDKKHAGDILEEAMADSKAAEASGTEVKAVNADEKQKEEAEIELVLEQLNLAAVGNNVFSISDETRELLRKFTLVFKDLVNGVPTAYHDLEALLTNSEDQLQKMWLTLPPFLQQLVSKLPGKFSASLAPEVLAAAAEKPAFKSSTFDKGAAAASKAGIKFKVPSLKDLVGKKGALISMFRAIMTSLRTRFPAIMGLNILWSIAIAVLLLICWYCHKRGKEVRLEKERAVTEAEMEEIKKLVEADPPAEWNERMTTLAPPGSTIEEVRASLAPAEGARTPGITEYAQGGSLAQDQREQEQIKPSSSKDDAPAQSSQATTTVREIPEDVLSLADGDRRLQAERKAALRAEKMKRHPSQAPLNSQDSCIVS